MRRFPLIHVTGGPAGKNTKLTVDGEEQHGVHRVEVEMDVNEIVRVKTFQFADVDIEVSGTLEDPLHRAFLRKLVVEEIPVEGAPSLFQRVMKEIAVGEGATIRDALADLLAKAPED